MIIFLWHFSWFVFCIKMDRTRGSSVNEEQKKLLIEYVKQHPELLKGTFSSTFTLLMAKKLWEEISSMLNSVSGGAIKDWRQWRKVSNNRNVTNNV